jgi:hypothetical protein
MTKRDFVLIANVLQQFRHIQAEAPIYSTTAMIACDLSDAFKAAYPNFDPTLFHRAIQEVQA